MYYRVQRGDSLYSIARRAYGNGNAWTYIYRANRNQIANPNLINPGEVLYIPE